MGRKKVPARRIPNIEVSGQIRYPVSQQGQFVNKLGPCSTVRSPSMAHPFLRFWREALNTRWQILSRISSATESSRSTESILLVFYLLRGAPVRHDTKINRRLQQPHKAQLLATQAVMKWTIRSNSETSS